MHKNTSHSTTMNGHGPSWANDEDEQKGALPTVSPGKLHYSKAVQKAAFAECRAAVAEHDSCVCQLHAGRKRYSCRIIALRYHVRCQCARLNPTSQLENWNPDLTLTLTQCESLVHLRRWNAVEDLEHVRFTDDVAPVARVSIAQVCCEPNWVHLHSSRAHNQAAFPGFATDSLPPPLPPKPDTSSSRTGSLDPAVNDLLARVSAGFGAHHWLGMSRQAPTQSLTLYQTRYPDR